MSGGSGRKVLKKGYIRVERLPTDPIFRAAYRLDGQSEQSFTNNLFRFPAKFHPPVVRWALDRYATDDTVVLDPFTGSGTVQVEAFARGISSVGVDVDPLACLVTRAKTTVGAPDQITRAARNIEDDLSAAIRRRLKLSETPGGDITAQQFARESRDIWIPQIPNIHHWFRRYVVIDLATLLDAIDRAAKETPVRDFLLACFAATIRRVSNADPSPVSGLEVTRVQAGRNKTRCISVFDDFFEKVRHEAANLGVLHASARDAATQVPSAIVVNGSALDLSEIVVPKAPGIDLVVTSPPYCGSVEYSRRHRLEFYWLGFISSQVDFLELKHQYVGRPYVRVADAPDIGDLPTSIARVASKVAKSSRAKARVVSNYFAMLRSVSDNLASVVSPNGIAVLVVGESVVAGTRVRTGRLLADLMHSHFSLDNEFLYAIRNFSMQYGLRNGSGIKREHVLVFRKR